MNPSGDPEEIDQGSTPKRLKANVRNKQKTLFGATCFSKRACDMLFNARQFLAPLEL
ncbi:hypothetical protein FBU59_000637 [Linderina macrospora]|uniref:Uncharacterized protein n=1 Tax=Linderina macrospora TaxID=4868 RepID=A0ACC1JG91_9FUNG|nr:hypothetical protein FBU59_000637 [Linderina macrospora]